MSKQDRPVGAKLGWRMLENTYPFDDAWRKLRQDRVHIEVKGEQTFIYTSPAFGGEKCHIFLALGVALTSDTEPESTEVIRVEPVPAPEALKMARAGPIHNNATGMAILLWEELIREYGYA